jgi:hypothetical protein
MESLEADFHPEEGDVMFLRNTGIHLQDYAVLQHRKSQSEQPVA